jgi:hypothetical protein
MTLDAEGVVGRLLRITIGFFLLGILLIIAAEILLNLEQLPEKSWSFIFLRVAAELGVAFIIASIVAFIFERLLSRERLLEISKLLGEQREMEQFGFKKIFATRQMLFDELFERTIPTAAHHIKIMGICVSLFKEAGREPRPITQPNAKRIRDLIVDLLIGGCTVQVLYLKRYPSDDELKDYGITGGDFFSMRERDEDEDINFLHGKRLKKIANASHGDWIRILIGLTDRTKDLKQFKTEDARRQLFNRLQIREYFALPSVSLYIIDQEIYVTPYLYKKHCSDVPAFKVARKDSPLYKSYEAHFAAAWDNVAFTTPAVPESFTELLVKDPHRTLRLYKEKEDEAIRQRQALEKQDQTYIENPEYYRIEEKAIELTLEAQRSQQGRKTAS